MKRRTLATLLILCLLFGLLPTGAMAVDTGYDRPIEQTAQTADPGINLAGPLTMNTILQKGDSKVSADKFIIYKDGTGSGSPAEDVTTGTLSENAPDLSTENLYFDHAEVDGKRVYEVGSLNDLIYYSSFSGALSVLGDGETIGLYYVSKYPVTYQVESGLKTAGDDLVKKGESLTFRAKPSVKGKRLNVLVNGKDITSTGTIYDSATGEMLFTVENVQEAKTVTIREVDAGNYTLTYNNDTIRNGSITKVSPESIQPGKAVTIEMTASGSGPINYFVLNMLVINGYGVTMLPSDAEEGASVESTLPSGETVQVTLTQAHNGWRPKEYDPIYTITISNVYTDLQISEGNFKLESRNEIILKELTGIKEIVGWDSQRDFWGNETGSYVTGNINHVYAQTTGSGNEFYFNLQPGYEKPALIVKSNGSEIDEATVHFEENRGALHNGKEPSFTYAQYQYRFDMPNDLGDNVEVFLSATPIKYSVEYRNDKNNNDLIGQPETGFTVVAGNKDTITITSLAPYETVKGLSPDGYIVKGSENDPNRKVYHSGDTVKVADVAAYAQGSTITFIPNWVPTEELDERQITINLYIEDPTNGQNILADRYLLTVAEGKALFRPNDERGRQHIAEYITNSQEDWKSTYNESDFVLRDGEDQVCVVEADQNSLDFHYDVKKGQLTVNFQWGTGESGSGDLPESITKSVAIKQKYTEDISGSIPEGYMASETTVSGTMTDAGVTKTVYLYRDGDGDNKPDAYTITLTFDAEDPDTAGTISQANPNDGGVLSNENKTLTYKLVKAGAAGITADTYPGIPNVTVTTEGKGWLGWRQSGTTGDDHTYGKIAGTLVPEDAADIAFDAKYDVAAGYETVTINYYKEIASGTFEEQPFKTIKRLAKAGTEVTYAREHIDGLVTPDEGTSASITVTAGGANTADVYYYLDTDKNGKPDTYTLTLSFQGSGHGSWDTEDTMWAQMEEGKDYIYNREKASIVVFLVKENNKGFDADIYPDAPKIKAEQLWIFDSWQDEKGKTYGSGADGDGITIKTSVGENDPDRSYQTIYSEDKNNNQTPDEEETVTVTFQVVAHGTINGQTELIVTDLLPINSTYPQAPAVTVESGYVFTGWNPVYDKGGMVEEGADRNQVYTAVIQPVSATQYTLTVQNGSGSGTYAAGTPVTITAAAAPSGKVFDRWVSSNGGTFANAWSPSTTFTMPGNHVTVTATYRDNDSTVNPDPGDSDKYTLYYHSNFGSDKHFYQSDDDSRMEVRDYRDMSFLPEREGYTFQGWNTKADGSGKDYRPGDTFQMNGSSGHLYAQWVKNGFTSDDTGVSRWLNSKEHVAYLSGYSNGLFSPDSNMTRAQAAQMFYNLLLDKNVPVTVTFSDVPADAWCATAVNTLASLGILNGVGDGKFAPDRPITRAEFTVIAMRFTNGTSGGETGFSDVSADDWFYHQVAGAVQYGWISGYSDKTFRPYQTITRAEVTTIVNRMLGRSADERYVDRHSEDLNQFSDVQSGHWAYHQIMEATNAHDYEKNGGTESWTKLW